jgi:hypothetical protein
MIVLFVGLVCVLLYLAATLRADLNITPANVELVTSSRGPVAGTSGVPILAGQTCYLNTPGDGRVYLGKASGNALQSGNSQGFVCLNSAPGSGQPVQLFAQGTYDVGANNLVVGGIYVFSNNSGNIAPFSDMGTNSWITIIGVAISGNEIETPSGGIFASATQHQ